MFINFSVYPLRIGFVIGFFFLLAGFMGSIYIIVEKVLYPGIPMGITSILVAVFVFGGIQLMIMGLVGEYVGKLFLAGNQTPQYVVRHTFSEEAQHTVSV